MSCMSLTTFNSLKLNLTKERFPLVVTATGTSMDPIGFTQCTFFINGRSFTQKFIVCTNQTRPVILARTSLQGTALVLFGLNKAPEE